MEKESALFFRRGVVWGVVMAGALIMGCTGHTTPRPPTATPANAAVGPSPLERGRQVLRRAMEGFGGMQRVDRLRTMVVQSVGSHSVGEAEMAVRQRTFLEYPRRFRREVLAGETVAAVVISPEQSFMISPLGAFPLEEAHGVELERTIARSPLSLLKGRSHESFEVIADGEGDIDGRPVDFITVLFVGDSNRLAIDRETGYCLELRYTDQPLGAPVNQSQTVTIRYGDFREVNGLVYPFESLTTREGEPQIRFWVESLEIDVDLDPSLFRKPAIEE